MQTSKDLDRILDNAYWGTIYPENQRLAAKASILSLIQEEKLALLERILEQKDVLYTVPPVGGLTEATTAVPTQIITAEIKRLKEDNK